MKKRLGLLLTAFIIIAAVLTGCAQTQQNDSTTLFQVSTLEALILGGFDGTITVEELLKHGDTGIGTYDGLDGEMIVIDGKAYKVKDSGEVLEAEENDTIPFADVAFFEDNEECQLNFAGGYAGLKAAVEAIYPDENIPVMFVISGEFIGIEFRSVPKQQKPYPLLADVLANQAVFERETISGSLVGFRMPEYFGEVNAVGYHLHFISDDRRVGGHLLNVESGSVKVCMQMFSNFQMYLPDTLKEIDTSVSEEVDEA